MDQDILNSSNGNTTGRENPLAPAAAIAAAPLLLAEAAFSLKNLAEHETVAPAPVDNAAVLERLTSLAAGFDGDAASGVARALLQVPADLHQPLLDIFNHSMRHVSGQKNISITPELQREYVEAIIQCLEPAILCGIVHAEPRPLRLMVDLIDYMLDLFAAMQLMRTLWQLRGFEEIEFYSFWKPAEKWVQNRAANDIGRNRLWWPTVLEMIVDHYRPQLPDRLVVRYPESQSARATWQLDRAAFNGVAKIGAQGKPPQFLVARMNTCPCLPGNYMPDGKLTARYPDEVVTAWYRNGLVHRDPKEGPAFHSVEPHREVSKYMVDGQPHRDHRDGPAWIDTNRDGLHVEEFYWHGQFHRPAEEGPALLRRDSSGYIVKEVYCEHGQRHRDPGAGPSLISTENGQRIEEYTVDGQPHRDEGDGPAVIRRDENNGHVVEQAYFWQGKCHRVSGPAYFHLRPDGTRIESWYQHDNLHRNAADGPAYVQQSPDGVYIEYVENGKTHRDHRDGPAIIDTNHEGKGIRLDEYYAHGKRHRPSTEGPAVLKIDRDGNCVQESYHEDDRCHRDPAQGPAWAGIEDGERIEAYMTYGEHHRPEQDGPAVTRRDPESGRLIRQTYYLSGKCHRIDGPAFIEYRSDGSLFMESWYRDDVCHRDPLDGPAMIWNSDVSSEMFEEFFVDGVVHRDPAHGPASITRNKSGAIISESYIVKGEFHRDDGPAIIYRDPETGDIERAEHWLHGKSVDAQVTEEIPQ